MSTLIEAIARGMCNCPNAFAADKFNRLPKDEVFDLARAALLAIEASGHVVVPSTPTQDMVGASMLAWAEGKSVESRYAAMIAARPEGTTP